MQSYEQFWETLAPAYPVSKGQMRLPIVAALQDVVEIDMPATVRSLAALLQQLLDEQGSLAGAQARALAAGEGAILPLLTSDYTGVVRFDCALDTAGKLRVLELNADYPDGFVLHDHTYNALGGVAQSLHSDQLLQLCDAAPAVHIAHSEGVGFLDAYHAERVVLETAGHSVTVGPMAAASEGAWLRRCVEVSKLSAAELAASAETMQVTTNSWALRTLGYKQLLASVSHPLLPETVCCDTEAAVASVAAEPDRFVLKPGQGCEGEGIYFGTDYEPGAWSSLLAQLPAGYVAQERVAMATRSVPVYDAGGIEERTLYFDICPHFFVRQGQVVGSGHVLMRFSESPIVNVSQGGAIGYHYLPA
jgi:hypothetical protein